MGVFGRFHDPLGSWMALGVGIVGVLGLYVVFGGPDDFKKKKKALKASKKHPKGLRNIGNTCYINVVMQALASSHRFVEWAEKTAKQVAKPDEDPSKSLIRSLHETMASVNNTAASNEMKDSASQVLTALRLSGWQINPIEQDALEILQVLFTGIEEELSRCEQPMSLNDFRNAVQDDDEDEVFEESSIKNKEESKNPFRKIRNRSNSGIFSRIASDGVISTEVAQQTHSHRRRSYTPFSGKLTSRVSFQNGSSKSPTLAISFNNITLHFPRPSPIFSPGISSITLETLLKIYVTSEIVEGEDKKMLLKQVTIGKLPECICFHIQRTAVFDGIPMKQNNVVSFPHILDMSQFTYLKPKNPVEEIVAKNYELTAVIVHAGEIDSGHYVTLRRGPLKNDKSWYLISDSHVEKVSLQFVLQSQAYMLFYEKV